MMGLKPSGILEPPFLDHQAQAAFLGVIDMDASHRLNQGNDVLIGLIIAAEQDGAVLVAVLPGGNLRNFGHVSPPKCRRDMAC